MDIQKRGSTRTELEMSFTRGVVPEVKDQDGEPVMEDLSTQKRIEEFGGALVTELAGKLEKLGKSVHEIHVKVTIYSD